MKYKVIRIAYCYGPTTRKTIVHETDDRQEALDTKDRYINGPMFLRHGEYSVEFKVMTTKQKQ